MNLLLFGPPGAGKGTQSSLLIDRHRMAHVSTGELFRTAIKAKTSLGNKAKKFMDEGQLVPDNIVIGMVEEEFKNLNDRSFILDGFPRTVNQAEALDKLLAKSQKQLHSAVFIDVPHRVLIGRLTGRRVCKSCGTVFHLETKPPKVSGVCDVCGAQLYQRSDDHPDVIGQRLQSYDTATAPLKDYYKSKNLFVLVDGIGSEEEVYERIMSGLEKRSAKN